MPYANLCLVHTILCYEQRHIPICSYLIWKRLTGSSHPLFMETKGWGLGEGRGHRQMQGCVMDMPDYSMNNSWGGRSTLSCCWEFTQSLMSPICHLYIQQEFCCWLERQQGKAQYQTSDNVISVQFCYFLRDAKPAVTTLAHAFVTTPQKGKLGLQHFILCSKMTAKVTGSYTLRGTHQMSGLSLCFLHILA